MNWAAIGAIGELAGAIGVIATLGYLAFQIRQNTRQLVQNELSSRATAANVCVIAVREMRRTVYESSELTEIWLKGMNNPDELAENDFYRFRLLMQNVIDGIWDIHSQTVVTGFLPETWETQGVTVVERVIATPGGHRVWAQFRENYPSEFRVEVDRILASKSDAN